MHGREKCRTCHRGAGSCARRGTEHGALPSAGRCRRYELSSFRVENQGLNTKCGHRPDLGRVDQREEFPSIDLAAHVARGRPWFGHKTKQSPVVLLFLEGQGGAKQRLAAYQSFHGEPLPNNILVGVAPTTLYKGEDVDALAAAIPEGSLVVIDTQACATVGLSENDSTEMGLFIESAKRLATTRRCFVLCLHHSGKDSGRGARGSSVQLPSWDFAAEVVREGQRRFWRAVKVKDGDGEGEKHPFQLGIVDLGADEDGDRITSCVALPDAEDLAGQEGKTLTPNQKYALESLREALGKEGCDSIHVDAWRPYFYGRHTGDNDKTKAQAFRRGRNELVNLGVILVTGYIYSINKEGDRRHLDYM
ncbi:AAA family ATPase [Desulfovibrio legallii]|uniref:AAA family ATPase n=1 Tax=Desulfovibrio legallii TaxID=571438 RepID=A0A6H3FCM5_9BACT|nr:AAA family ATPase [Desulfovibrio legallii]